jgi:hypothetical protein
MACAGSLLGKDKKHLREKIEIFGQSFDKRQKNLLTKER